MITYVKMETAEAYELQIFDIIEEIQDTIETAENQTEPNAVGTETLLPGRH